MIDTIRVNLADTIIKDSAKIQVQPGFIDLDSGLQPESDLFVTESKKTIRGKKAFINDEFFNLTILPKQTVYSEQTKHKKVDYLKKIYGRAADGSIEVDQKQLLFKVNNDFDYNSRIFLQTSLPKINSYLEGNNTYNLETLNNNQILSSLSFINKRLQDFGIVTNLDDSNLSRLDLFNNINTSLAFSEYKGVFSQLSLSRKRLQEFAGETFLFGNKSSQMIIYDKTNELFLKHNVTVPEKWTRFENRHLNKKKIFNTFKGKELKLILNQELFRDEMTKLGYKIFNKKKIEIDLVSQSELYEKLLMKKNTGRYWLRNFFYNEGLNSVLARIPKTILLNVLQELMTRDKFYRIKREINNFSFNLSVFSDAKMTNLYDEIRNKYFSNLEKAA